MPEFLALLGLATVRLIAREVDRTRFDLTKSERVPGLSFRPREETLRDDVEWYRANGWLTTQRGSHSVSA